MLSNDAQSALSIGEGEGASNITLGPEITSPSNRECLLMMMSALMPPICSLRRQTGLHDGRAWGTQMTLIALMTLLGSFRTMAICDHLRNLRI